MSDPIPTGAMAVITTTGGLVSIPDAPVEFYCLSTNSAVEILTDAKGHAILPDAAPGDYNITIKLAGFFPWRKEYVHKASFEETVEVAADLKMTMAVA